MYDKHVTKEACQAAEEHIASIRLKAELSLFVKDQKMDDGARFVRAYDHLSVILSVAVEDDQRKWLHVSLAHRNRLPTYETLKLVKDTFIGDRKAIQVFPSEKEYVNKHPYCLHLWCCLDGDPLPDFTHGSGSI